MNVPRKNTLNSLKLTALHKIYCSWNNWFLPFLQSHVCILVSPLYVDKTGSLHCIFNLNSNFLCPKKSLKCDKMRNTDFFLSKAIFVNASIFVVKSLFSFWYLHLFYYLRCFLDCWRRSFNFMGGLLDISKFYKLAFIFL